MVYWQNGLIQGISKNEYIIAIHLNLSKYQTYAEFKNESKSEDLSSVIIFL